MTILVLVWQSLWGGGCLGSSGKSWEVWGDLQGLGKSDSLPMSDTKDVSNRHFPGIALFCQFFSAEGQGRKKNPNPNFLVRIFSGGFGVFHVNGWGAKKFGMSLETREIKLFGRDIPRFCWDIPEGPEKFEKKKFVFNSRPLEGAI